MEAATWTGPTGTGPTGSTSSTTTPQPEKAKAKAKKEKVLHDYRVFMKDPAEANAWTDLGIYNVASPADARKEAVKKHEMEDGIRAGRVTLVALANRFWIEKTPKAEPQPDKLTWD